MKENKSDLFEAADYFANKSIGINQINNKQERENYLK